VRLRAAGYDVVVRPVVEIEPIESGLVDLDGYDWLVLTSATGARELKRRAKGQPAQVAAIGRSTAQAWGAVDLVPRISSQEGLLAELPRPAGRVLFAGAEGARPLLAHELGADVVVLYRTRSRVPSEPIAADLAVVASPSAARALAEATRTIPVVSIGPETTAAATAAGLTVAGEAMTQDLDGLVSAVRAAG
jgi:uroporphyrinogen-III synthase